MVAVAVVNLPIALVIIAIAMVFLVMLAITIVDLPVALVVLAIAMVYLLVAP